MPSLLDAVRASPLLLAYAPSAAEAPRATKPPFAVILDEFGYYASEAWVNFANGFRSMSEEERLRRLQETIDAERAVLRDTVAQVLAQPRPRARL